MISQKFQHIGFLVISLLLSALTLFGLNTGVINSDKHEVFTLLPYLLVPTAILLGLRFNRSRLVLASFINGVLIFLLCYMPSGPWFSRVQLAAVCIAPLLFGTLVWKRERGLISSPGIPWTIFTALVLIVPIFFWNVEPLYFTKIFAPVVNLAASGGSWFLYGCLTVGLLSCLVAYLVRRGSMEVAFLCMTGLNYLAATKASLPNVQTGGHDPFQSLIIYSLSLVIGLAGLIEMSHSLAFKDELTGVPGRRALLEAMAKLGSHYAIAMSDIDHFKKFNDTYGHDTGDEVLIKVAGILSTVGGGGRAYRYGGEEFVIIFDGLSSEEAFVYLEKLRLAVAGSKLEVYKPAKGKRPAQKVDVKITISMGVAEPDEYLSKPERVLKAADKALYMAKENGRNQVQDYRNPNVEKKSKKKAPAKKPAAKKSAESAAGDKPKLKIVKNSGRENKKSA